MLPTISGEFKVVKEPEIRFNQSGKGWAKLRVLASDNVKKDDGTWESKDPLFIDVTILAGAEAVVEAVNDKDVIWVTGKLRMREWEKDGVKQTTFEILAGTVAKVIPRHQRAKQEDSWTPPAQETAPPF